MAAVVNAVLTVVLDAVDAPGAAAKQELSLRGDDWGMYVCGLGALEDVLILKTVVISICLDSVVL